MLTLYLNYVYTLLARVPKLFFRLNKVDCRIFLHKHTQAISDKLTIVTAYFEIGSFTKGPWQIPRSPADYRSWLTAFQGLHSPVIAYFDSQANVKMFTDLRRRLPANLTIVRKVNKDQVSDRYWLFIIM